MSALVLSLMIAAAPPTGPGPAPPAPLDLRALWSLAQESNPLLQEAAARVAAARGRQVQAGTYPNPQASYEQEELGTRQAAAGALRVQVTQEIVTGHKRGLDLAVAGRGTEAAVLASRGQQFEVLTRVRRAYAEFLGAHQTAVVYQETLHALEQAREATRKLVEIVKSRPATDLVRLEALVEEARINLLRGRLNRRAAWQQLAAEVGLPDLPPPERIRTFPEPSGRWDAGAVRHRVLSANTALRQAAVEVERARLAVERARAEVVPNVTVGGGYSRNFAENEAGAVISLQTRLPLWDRNQGRIQTAEAEWFQAQAALRTTANRLARDTAEAWARYRGAGEQLRRLSRDVLPRVRRSLQLVQQGYRSGAAQVGFADVLIAQQALNDINLKIAQTRRELWGAVADLEGLMQLDVGEELCSPGTAGASAPGAGEVISGG